MDATLVLILGQLLLMGHVSALLANKWLAPDIVLLSLFLSAVLPIKMGSAWNVLILRTLTSRMDYVCALSVR